MQHLPRTFIAALLTLSTVNLALAAPPERGGQAEDRLRQRVDRLTREPARAQERVTLILEADALQQSEVSPHEGLIRYRRGRLHEVSIPANRVEALLNALPSNVLARLPYPHQAVAVTGQGVAITGAADMQALGKNAAGIKVGVIDLGFGSLSTAQASGDLPPTGPNLTITDYTGTGTGGTDHGTNVAEIVHEMAPGASLYLAKISTEVQLGQALDAMTAAGVKVINHSVAWYGAAFYDGTGPICDIANRADTQGAQWVNAMGNSRLKHYLGTFSDSNADLRHEFATGQNYNTISLTSGSAVSLILNWNAYPTTTIDYDLYLYNGNPDSGGVVVASSLSRQSGRGGAYYPYPYEAIDYTPTTTGTFYIVVKKVNSSQANRSLTLFSTGPDLVTRTTASSILQPADCAKVIGVGAVNFSNDNAEAYSSEGPTTDGRAKPEIAAPDGVTTSLSGGFWGTSAASPHATGAAALVLANNPTMTPAQLRAALPVAVKDVNTAGFDYRTGSGRISLDADGDGLNHDAELSYGTSPTLADTDGDGLTDSQEIQVYGTSPTLADTDGDGLTDGQEVLASTNPNLSNKGDLAPKSQPDGVVNIADLLILTRFVGQLDAPSAQESALGDINSDGVLDVRDILLLRQQLGN